MLKWSDEKVLQIILNTPNPITIREMSQRSRYCERTIRRSIKRLETLEMIRVHRLNRTNTYEVLEDTWLTIYS